MKPLSLASHLAAPLQSFTHASGLELAIQTRLTALRKKLCFCWRKTKDNIVYRTASKYLPDSLLACWWRI